MPTQTHYGNASLTDKVQLINSIVNVVTAGKIVSLTIFDQTGAVSTITDRSGNGHTTTLRDGSLSAINASTCTPSVAGIAPYLTTDATHLFNMPDSASFSFALSPMSVVVLTNPTDVTVTASDVLSKYDTTTGAEQREWRFLFASGILQFRAYDNTDGTRIGRSYNTSLAADNGVWKVYGATYDGGALSSGIGVYRDGIKIDDTNVLSGTFTSMRDTTSLVGNYNIGTAGTVSAPYVGKQAVTLIVSEALTAAQMLKLDAILRLNYALFA